jgi:putative nucleotidyltransferase with HDIG domain
VATVADGGAVNIRTLPRSRLGGWLLIAAGVAATQLGSSQVNGVVLRAPWALFLIVLVAASGCVCTSAVVLWLADRDDRADVGFLGSFFMAVSALALVHGLTTPGVLFDDNAATMSSVFWSVPVAVVGSIPQLLRSTSFGRWAYAHWRPIVTAEVGFTIAVCGALLVRTDLLPVPAPAPFGRLIGVLSFAACVFLALRHVALSDVAAKNGPAWVGVGYLMSGATVFAYPAAKPFSFGFWLAHGLDIGGVFLATILGFVAYRSTGSLVALLRPVTVHEPLSALELGLDDTVRAFVADVDRKDRITRDHVVRTAELAVRVGVAMNLEASEIRALGLGALLHDLGKVAIPDEILKKAGRLDDSEMAVMRSHVSIGAEMVSASLVLCDVAPIVRHHHERVDGNGYPDGLRGNAIPLAARIVSACDAFDAMANSRQYRQGMGTDRAVSILREHQGSQWDGAVVDALVQLVETHGVGQRETALSRVGRERLGAATNELTGPCGCVEVETLTDEAQEWPESARTRHGSAVVAAAATSGGR